MPQVQGSRSRGHLGRGALYSLLLHAALLMPIGIVAFVLGAREEAQRAEEVDVGFESVPDSQLPENLPPLEPPKAAEDALEKLKPEAQKPPPQKKKPLEEPLAKKDEPKPKPEPEVVAPPMPPMPEPAKPPPPEQTQNKKSVEVENENNQAPPPDAKYLAEKNNRVDRETRATETNLEKASKGKDEPASAPSDRKDEKVGGPKDQIRQLADEKSAAGKMAPSVTPHKEAELASPDQRREKSLLALRDPAPRTHELTPETADPSLPHAADGELAERPPSARGADSRADRAKGNKVKLAITGSDYEYMFGADAEAERRLAKKMKSTRMGQFRERQARVQSSLENFIPEVQPGNQTALNTRAAPFAAFVARMHRSIHVLWGFGALEDWDELGSSSPLNNQNLLTTLEIVLNSDGTVDKVTIVRASGYLPYDTAAIDTAFAAGPYPEPPREIRSANGKIYVHWRFYRDGRQCATPGVDYFILNNPPKDGDRSAVAGGGLTPARNALEAGAPVREGPRRLRRDVGDDEAHRAKMQALDQEVARAEGRASASSHGDEEPAPESARTAAAAAPVAEARDPDARAVATRFFSGLSRGDLGLMSGLSEVPFRTTGGGTVKTKAELGPMLKDLSSELGQKAVSSVQVMTAAGVRSMLGRLPPGLDDGTGLVFAVAVLPDGDALIASLAKRGAFYHVVALVRR
ncbi:MAG TPA: energy transducer TonB [Polyangia bacterium]|jgi:TonB family protein|nr:energy transducer TonB [Polyangia bacterium]